MTQYTLPIQVTERSEAAQVMLTRMGQSSRRVSAILSDFTCNYHLII